MTEAIESKTSTAEEKSDRKAGMMIPASFRADLVMQKQLFRKEEYYVVKDPLALTYFRLRTEEAYLGLLAGGDKQFYPPAGGKRFSLHCSMGREGSPRSKRSAKSDFPTEITRWGR